MSLGSKGKSLSLLASLPYTWVSVIVLHCPVFHPFSSMLIYTSYFIEYQSKLAAPSIRNTERIYYWLQNPTQKDNPQGRDGNPGAEQPLVPVHRSVCTWWSCEHFWWTACFRNKIHSHFKGTFFFISWQATFMGLKKNTSYILNIIFSIMLSLYILFLDHYLNKCILDFF